MSLQNPALDANTHAQVCHWAVRQWAAVCLMNSTSFLLERRCNLKVVMKGVMMPASQAHAPATRCCLLCGGIK